jgi:S-adenosylmethionine-diacylglycerol 3-amino-3-carboxypropyl transferase
LVEEWREILAHAAPRARVIFRSAHARPKYLDTISVDGVRLTEHLLFHEDLARELSRQDRVHTYAGFHICDVPA